MNWQEQAATSHYQTAVAVGQQFKAGHVEEASAGIEELIEALSRWERRALESHLVRLMAHILKWQVQPARRGRSWVSTIKQVRRAIQKIQKETPSLNEAVIHNLWDECFEDAKDVAVAETDLDVGVKNLSWDEVFVEEYRL
jgi:hypothetical protein